MTAGCVHWVCRGCAVGDEVCVQCMTAGGCSGCAVGVQWVTRGVQWVCSACGEWHRRGEPYWDWDKGDMSQVPLVYILKADARTCIPVTHSTSHVVFVL